MTIRHHALRTAMALSALCFALPASAAEEPWGGAWGYAPSPATRAVQKAMPAGTYRYRIRLSQSGDGLRLTLRNPDSARPVRVASITVAAAADGAGLDLAGATLAKVTFEGQSGPLLTPGQPVLSDTVPFAAKSGGDIIVSIAFSEPTVAIAARAGMPTGFAKDADLTVQSDDKGIDKIALRPIVTLVSVRHPAMPCTIVALGDSITEGVEETSPNTRGWPGRLAERLEKDRPGRHCGVVNMGISGNRVLAEGRGTAAIDRFARDIMSVPNVTTVIMLEGINDIAKSGFQAEPEITAEMLVGGYKKVIAMAHARGLRILGGTMTPAFGSVFIPADKEAIRQKANGWIRSSGAFDGVIDFEKSVSDGQSPPRLRLEYDSGGRLHPNDPGYHAMGNAIDLALVQPQ